MDSGLLNAYQDEQYEANYDHFESSVSDLWSTADIGIGSMELTDTLDGILPIAATETETNNCNIYDDCDIIYHDEEVMVSENLLVYNDFAQQQIYAEERVGPIDTDIYVNDMSESSSYSHVETGKIIEDDAVSKCSEYSFRTRTDSSSIGDYESHSSDYEDDENYEDEAEADAEYQDGDSVFERENNGSQLNESRLEKDDILCDLPEFNLLYTDDFVFTNDGKKQRTISTNTIGSDVDPANFDLAEFITSDDVPTKIEDSSEVKKSLIKPVVQIISSTINESDSDSDIIVDVETVETEEAKERALLLKNVEFQMPAEDNLAYVDNVKEDPSWSPKEMKTKQSSNKKHNDILKNSKANNAKCSSIKSSNKAITEKPITKNVIANIQNRGIGKSGKNLSLLKRDCGRIEKNCSQTTRIKEKDIALLKHDSHRIDPRTQNNVLIIKTVETEKRKLNLEEYKRRHGEDFSNAMTKSIENNKSMISMQTTTKPIVNVAHHQQSPIKAKPVHSEVVTSIVKSLKEEQINTMNTKIDPITQAKMKVLRMQELKKAQQMKIIDSTISAKVPRVTKLLPLQEIIKDTAYAIKDDHQIVMKKPQLLENSNYVKIVMVSSACNTVLSLSPSDLLPNVPLLDNITRVTEHVKISNSSLITSIQDAIVKQSSIPKMTCNPATGGRPTSILNTSMLADISCVQHGEDKIIMHLRKDRIRGPTRSIEIQTDFVAAFPTLPKVRNFSKLKTKKSRHRQYRHKKSSSANSPSFASSGSPSSSSSSGSSESDNESDNYEKCNNNFKVDEYASTGKEYQNMKYENSEAATSIGGYSSRSSRHHRSSVSSSYSESVHQKSSQSRQRRSSYRKSARKHTRRASSSSSSSMSEYSDCSQSQSQSHSRGRSRSRSRRDRTRSRSPYYRRQHCQSKNNTGDPNVSKPDVEERRIVYVGRIEEDTSKEMLRRKFIAYGPIKQITFHYKDNGMKYGFVTYERAQDAFQVIDNSTKDSQINMYDISFGGRRVFCRTSYADLDNAGINNYLSYVFPKAVAQPKQEDSFEALLQKVKAKLDANKSSSNNKI